MSRIRFLLLTLPVILAACSSIDNQGTIAELRNKHVEIKDAQFEGGLDKAMMSYQRFLVETPDSALAPEAIRRLADLKVEKEYGLLTDTEGPADSDTVATLPAHEAAMMENLAPTRMSGSSPSQASASIQAPAESDADFAKRAEDSPQMTVAGPIADEDTKGPIDLEKAGPLEAIALYQKLLDQYPLYERNDQVLYQMSRAYEELGRLEDAMNIMDRLVLNYPDSRYIDEVQFRRAEYFFTRRKYLDAEEAYIAIEKSGVSSTFYPFALYKLGWAFYKQELYEEALYKFIALLDYNVSVGYDFEQTENETDRKRMEDTFRVVSLSLSSLGGAEIVADYFSRDGARSYEDLVYSNLGEYYFSKRRYSDANATYSAFVERNPFHKKSPHFQMRIIDINIAGGFPSLVIESKKEFATKYGMQAQYWTYFDPDEHPDVLSYLKTNLTDLANHYHALYQSPELKEQKSANFDEARHWYREFLVSFPMDDESPTINYQLADLLLENRLYDQAAVEYEKTAYDYPSHEKSSTAGYAAVFAYREHLDTDAAADKDPIKREVVRSSLRFAETFPGHEKAAVVLGAAVDDLYDMQDYEQAVLIAHQLVESFPEADVEVRRSVWIVIGHASYELHLYAEAEAAYLTVLEMLPPEDQRQEGLVDNLAASIYQQGAEANSSEDYRAAANHFLRISSIAPTSAIRPTAEFDAAASLIQLQDWAAAANVLTGFRTTFPNHELQPEVTKKIAYVYREDGRLAQAAGEYERIETESDDEEVRREALQTAAELYDSAGDSVRTLEVYQRYVAYFPRPVELNLETRNKISLLLKASNDQQNYLSQLKQIVAIDAAAGDSRTSRTRYLASKAALVLAEQSYDQFAAVSLVKPFDVNLRRKQTLMKEATQQFNQLLDYEVGEVTAAATFYLAEIYAHFSKALMDSERPDNLAPLELEQYELAIEEQAYPFEEKAIAVHENNLELISLGIYNRWVDRSLQRLAEFMPARYDRPEEGGRVIVSLETYSYEIDNPEPSVDPLSEEQAQSAVAVTVEQPVSAAPEPDMTRLAVEPEQSAPAEVQGEAQSTDGQVAQDDDKQLPLKTTTQKE